MRERSGDGRPEADQIGIGHVTPMLWPGCGPTNAQTALVTLPALRQRVHT